MTANRVYPLMLLSLAATITFAAGTLARQEPESARFAAVLDDQGFGDSSTRIVYPQQNWDIKDSLWFYNTTQGSDLMPYKMFLYLEQADSNRLFRAAQNMDRLRYLPQQPSPENPDGLPVGWVKDVYQKRDYIGLTCAACHTAQINYQGAAIRIDGGPALADMETTLEQLSAALAASVNEPAKFARLAKNVLGRNYPAAEASFRQELENAATEVADYVRINRPVTTDAEQQDVYVPYGFARVDAFGRIYNRVLAHLTPGEDNFNPANAPVSYPALWDTPQHDFVQWNGVGDNEDDGPSTRNSGEVLGVFATMNLQHQPDDKGYRSSIDTRNLRLLEARLHTLWSPRWDDLAQQKILPTIDSSLAAEGEAVYREYQCHRCHQMIDRENPGRRIEARFSSLALIGTDPLMALNVLRYTGRSGFFARQSPLKPGMAPFAATTAVLPAVSEASAGVLMEPDHDKSALRRWLENLYDRFTLPENPVKQTIRTVNFTAVDKHNPSMLATYKARPLNGVWATAPYLHNGSVANLYELFLPSCSDAEVAAGKRCRSNRFTLGSREFDPNKVGFVQRSEQEFPGVFVFDTSLPGNSNKGHEYAAGVTSLHTFDRQNQIIKDAEGKPVTTLLPPITEHKRRALVEYLKTL